jgi:hypothetical protein
MHRHSTSCRKPAVTWQVKEFRAEIQSWIAGATAATFVRRVDRLPVFALHFVK